MRPITKTHAAISLLAALGSMGSAAFADTLQGFICDERGSVVFQSPTSKDKQHVIPSTNRIAALTDAQAQGPVGIVYNVDPPERFQFITWQYKQANNSGALQGITARYCIQDANGGQKQSFDVAGGSGDRGGNIGDGWSQVVQDTRTFPSLVTSGNAYITKLTFIFKDKKNGANNITLGKVSISPGTIDVDNLITEIGDCNLKEKCVKPEKE